MSDFQKQVARNLKGQELEKTGMLDGAIAMYEANIKEGFGGNHPYDRLAIIYRKQNCFDEEIRVLRTAVAVFENLLSSPRQDVKPKLDSFRDRLEKALKRKSSST